jgi:hypothetical protein
MTNLIGDSNDPGVAAVFGEHTAGQAAIIGQSMAGRGVLGISDVGQGVWGHSVSSTGVVGVSTSGWGTSGESQTGPGVVGRSTDGAGVFASSTGNEAIHAETQSPGTAAIAAFNLNPNGTGAAVFAKKEGSQGHAGFFDGKVWVSGELGVGGDIILANADCAEDFDIIDASLVEPGTVMVLGEEGGLCQSQKAYDKRVAGVISGAGDYRPGIVLDKQASHSTRMPIALLGKVYCKVDASYAPIEVGDLLTTAPTPGHAMKADDPLKAFGAVIGKALRPLSNGQGLIPVLIALQ